MAAHSPPSPRAVRERLARVTDPELDESIVDLEYVDDVEITSRATAGANGESGDRVTVRMTLPTAWCSPAFAWMMATDARDEVESLPGVAEARIVLLDHMHDAEITEGVNERRAFEDVFPDAEGGVAAVRATLDDKARLARQYDAVEALLDAGVAPAQVASLARSDLDLSLSADRAAVSLADGAFAVGVPREPLADYVEKAEATGRVAGPDDTLFLTPEGAPIDVDDFELVHRRTRLAQVNMRGQGGLCDGLNEAHRKRLGRDR